MVSTPTSTSLALLLGIDERTEHDAGHDHDGSCVIELAYGLDLLFFAAAGRCGRCHDDSPRLTANRPGTGPRQCDADRQASCSASLIGARPPINRDCAGVWFLLLGQAPPFHAERVWRHVDQAPSRVASRKHSSFQ